MEESGQWRKEDLTSCPELQPSTSNYVSNFRGQHHWTFDCTCLLARGPHVIVVLLSVKAVYSAAHCKNGNAKELWKCMSNGIGVRVIWHQWVEVVYSLTRIKSLMSPEWVVVVWYKSASAKWTLFKVGCVLFLHRIINVVQLVELSVFVHYLFFRAWWKW